MASIQFTDADRDSRGFICLSPPAAEEASDAPAPSLHVARPTRPAAPPLSPRLRYQLTIAAAVVAGLLLILASMRLSGPRTVPVATAQALPTAAQIQPTTLPPTAPAVMLPAYGAPGSVQLGMIEATRAITPTAHYSSDWIQADVQGSGRVWLRAADWPGLAVIGPDLAPRPTATPRPYVPPTDPPQPPCLTAGTGAQLVTVCGWGDLEADAKAKWIATYGGTIGIVATPSPQEWNK